MNDAYLPGEKKEAEERGACACLAGIVQPLGKQPGIDGGEATPGRPGVTQGVLRAEIALDKALCGELSGLVGRSCRAVTLRDANDDAPSRTIEILTPKHAVKV